jgi:hypothetical protein
VACTEHPFSPRYIAFDVLTRSECENSSWVRKSAVSLSLYRFFSGDGAGNDDPLFVSLPTYVHLVPESGIDVQFVADLIRAAVEVLIERGGSRPDFARECDLVDAMWRDPWQSAKDELETVLNAKPQYRETALGETSGVESQSHPPEDAEAHGMSTFWASFESWFSLASDPAFVQRMEPEMAGAWVGSQEFQGSNLVKLTGRSTPIPWPGLTG